MEKRGRNHSIIALALKIGTLLSIAIISLGTLASIMSGKGDSLTLPQLAVPLQKIPTLPWQIAVINSGILVLMVTPILGVAAAAFSFALGKETKFAVAAAGVLIILFFSIFLALV